MTHASLFSGIGGFDLAAEWAGFRNVFQVEKDLYCQLVLKKHFPEVRRYGDIKKFDGRRWRGQVDIISGGFPCQPFSTAGKRRGTADDRFLWPEMLRIIDEIRPAWVLGENVAGIVSMELNNILSELERKGYDVQPFIIPAVAVDAPHRRDRVWIVCHAIGSGRDRGPCLPGRGSERGIIAGGTSQDVSNAEFVGLQRSGTGQGQASRMRLRSAHGGEDVADAERPGLFPAALPGVHSGEEGPGPRDEHAFGCGDATNPISQGLEICDGCGPRGPLPAPVECCRWPAEPGVGRVAHGISSRVDRLKCLGNAIVPQVAFQIFKAIAETERMMI